MTAGRTGIALAHGGSRAAVSAHGAELCSWHCAGRDLLWSGDPVWWSRRSPVLFPIVGRLRDGTGRLGGRTIAMEAHGFASRRPFEVVARGDDHARLVLRSDDETLSSYPYDFELSLHYRLHARSLEIGLHVLNTGDRAMPYSAGLHPGFRWPFSASGMANHRVRFSAEERPEVPAITADGLFTSAQRPLPMTDSCLPLDAATFEREALCFLDARSRRLRFESPDGAAIELETEDFPHWALWSRPGAPLLCIEAWTGHGDAADFQGEFDMRPSTRRLAPGATAQHALRLRFCPPGASQ